MTSQGAQSPSLVTTGLLVVAIIFPILGTLAVLLRVSSNISKAKRLFLDDYVIILAQLCAWGISIDIFVAAALGGVDYTKGTVLSATIVFLRVGLYSVLKMPATNLNGSHYGLKALY